MIEHTVSHYRITEKLGAGEMGAVYKAEATPLEGPVALKFLPEKYSGNKQALERFYRKAPSVSAFSHPSICMIHELGKHQGQGEPTSDSGDKAPAK